MKRQSSLNEVSVLSQEELESIAALRKWKEEKLQEIDERERSVFAKYYLTVPKSLRSFFEDEISILPNLVQYGRASRKYYPEDAELYGCSSLEAFRARLRLLAARWRGLVEIKTHMSGIRLEVTFTIHE